MQGGKEIKQEDGKMSKVEIKLGNETVIYARNDKGEWSNESWGGRVLEAEVREMARKHAPATYRAMFPVYATQGEE
jgi:hypothetical protein